ncbi:hypothetical protein E2562_009374 [Oryza meyeriana var. granulata]|uniref:HTH myb-type domain-containing protein n=1 Tax=Oryza meyeriana var. granulata TaxID=110450 RepID=A0A6G1CF12_9ORYZ|nr:hypothetical protein E2562_009374 [Oryza meyeriana var. granulata]
MWTPLLKQTFERAVQHVGIDGHPTKILEHMNLKGLIRQHVASHLQKYRAKNQKKDQLDERRLLSTDSLFLKAILPTLDVPPCNPLTLAAGAGQSSIASAAFAGGSFAAAPFQVPAPAGNAVISFNNPAVPAVVQAPAMGQRLSSGIQLDSLDAPKQKLYLGPFSYHGPPPPAMQNHINLLPAFPARVGMVMGKSKAPKIELPFGQPVDDLLDGETAYGGAGPSIGAPDAAAAYAYTGALQNNAAAGSFMAPPMGLMLSITEPIVASTQGEGAGAVVVASEEDAEAAVEEAAPINAEPFTVPDQVAADVPVVAAEEDIMFSLESLLGLDDDMLLPMEDAGDHSADAGDAAGEECGMEIGWDLQLEDILMENTNDFAFLDNLAGSE